MTDEYIKRSDVLIKLEIAYDMARTDQKLPISDLQHEVNLIKAADVQPVKCGRWTWDSSPEFGNPYGSYTCSECEEKQAFKENYCPNCGARMDGDTNG